MSDVRKMIRKAVEAELANYFKVLEDDQLLVVGSVVKHDVEYLAGKIIQAQDKAWFEAEIRSDEFRLANQYDSDSRIS